ncbi:MAG TPA: hypothetical protein VM366_01115 [Anaerolineae bacterium]|nr:hypothetical protein [Anaerolineae bacterium]
MARRRAKSLSEELRDRAARALLSYAVFRWESAITLALTLVLSILARDPFGGALPFWRWWFWILLGVAAEALIIVTSIYDPAVRERVVAAMFREKFDPSEIGTPAYRQKIAKALEYREQMEFLLQRTRDGALRTHLEATVNDVSDWISNMFTLARRLDHYSRTTILKQDKDVIPRELQALGDRMKAEADPAVRVQLQRSIQQKRAQLEQIERLDNTMERAALQLDDTLSAMGTVYAQVQLIDAKDIDSGRAQRLQQDIANQMQSLNDVQQAMDEVYLSSSASALVEGA